MCSPKDLEFVIGQNVYVLEPEDYVIRQQGQCFVGIQPMGMNLWYVVSIHSPKFYLIYSSSY